MKNFACLILADTATIFACVMNQNYKDTLNIADEISRTLTSGQDISTEQLSRLLDAYNRDGIKNDKVDNMIVATISNSIDCTLKDSGYEYKYEFIGDVAVLRVAISEKRKIEFVITQSNLSRVIPLLKSTIETVSILQSKVGDFSVFPYTDMTAL